VINKISPEPGLSSLVGISGQKWSPISPSLINILNNNERFRDWLAIVDKNRNFLVNRVHLQKQCTLGVHQILFPVLKLNPFLCQCDLHSYTEHAQIEIQQHNLIPHCQTQFSTQTLIQDIVILFTAFNL